MKITAAKVLYGRTYDLSGRGGNYAKFEMSLEAEIDPGDDEDMVMRALWKMAFANVNTVAAPVAKRQEERITEIWLGLPKDLREQLVAKHESVSEE